MSVRDRVLVLLGGLFAAHVARDFVSDWQRLPRAAMAVGVAVLVGLILWAWLRPRPGV